MRATQARKRLPDSTLRVGPVATARTVHWGDACMLSPAKYCTQSARHKLVINLPFIWKRSGPHYGEQASRMHNEVLPSRDNFPMLTVPSLNSIAARLRFRQLNFLITLADLGSLHRVADQLSMTQPGATKMLREIETTFGAQLFERSKRGMQPNELGRCVIRYARLSQSDLGHLREEIAGVLTGKGGRVSVGAIGGALPAVVVRALTRLRETQPALSVSVREDTSAGLLAALDEGRLDLAICRASVALQPERYAYERLSDEQVALAVGPHHPLAKARHVTLEDLMAYGWVLYPSPMPLRTLLEREFKEAGLALPSHTVETASTFVTILLLQESSNLVALLSAETMEFYRQHKMACKLPLEIRSRTEPYGIVTRRDWTLSPVAAMLVEALRSEANRRDETNA